MWFYPSVETLNTRVSSHPPFLPVNYSTVSYQRYSTVSYWCCSTVSYQCYSTVSYRCGMTAVHQVTLHSSPSCAVVDWSTATGPGVASMHCWIPPEWLPLLRKPDLDLQPLCTKFLLQVPSASFLAPPPHWVLAGKRMDLLAGLILTSVMKRKQAFESSLTELLASTSSGLILTSVTTRKRAFGSSLHDLLASIVLVHEHCGSFCTAVSTEYWNIAQKCFGTYCWGISQRLPRSRV